jgi:hypothetical protein
MTRDEAVEALRDAKALSDKFQADGHKSSDLWTDRDSFSRTEEDMQTLQRFADARTANYLKDDVMAEAGFTDVDRHIITQLAK